MNTAEMAKPFGKLPSGWTRSQYAQEFLNAYKSAKGHISLLEVTKGGNASGTWMHEDLALEFARWLNPAFAIWCNSRIDYQSKRKFSRHCIPND
ncbi:KilA-N domain-containing protein [Elizabethkingia meningoseptica]|uniref:KilA-N domain-containing protein n=1 Tax=Elizabethkingia meningoseptica TaxID=238 RepID=UPI00136634BD|nr:KilA-N domain-containing protein [Elizabethkingia meningoseptica]